MGVFDKSLEEGNKQFPGGSSKFFIFEEGDNRIRIVSPAQVFGQHYIPGVGYKVCIGKEEGCPWCKEQYKVSPFYFVWVIDRKDGVIKEAKLSYTVFKSINDTTEIKEYQFKPRADGIFPYDLNIRMIEGKLKNEKRQYNVLPAQPTELTEKEKEMVKKLKHPIEVINEMKQKALEEAGKIIRVNEQGEEIDPTRPDEANPVIPPQNNTELEVSDPEPPKEPIPF